MYPFKANGLDGMPPLFFQNFWRIIGNSVIAGCLNVLNDGGSVMDFNDMVISLIPKI